MMKVKCINNRWKDGLIDPDVTKGKFYTVEDSVMVMGSEPMYVLIGNDGTEIHRPRYIFTPMTKKKKLIVKRGVDIEPRKKR